MVMVAAFQIGLMALLPRALAVETVTISGLLPDGVHACVRTCVYDSFFTNMGDALGCARPYDNRCYCGTESSAATAASQWISRCAKSKCSSGDIQPDLTTMHYVYASYCIEAGYVQPGATDWYTADAQTTAPPAAGGDDPSDPAPSQTEGSAPETITEVTTVTSITEGGVAPTKSRVTEHRTTTIWVNPDGSRADGPSVGGSDSAWKIAVGVTVPVVFLIALGVAWFLWRRRRRSQRLARMMNQPPAYQVNQESPPPMTVSPVSAEKSAGEAAISRKPVPSTVSALSSPIEVSGVDEPQELNPEGVSAIPTAPPPLIGGTQEAQGQDTWPARPEMHGESRWTEMSGEGRSPELPGGQSTHPSELPGSVRY